MQEKSISAQLFFEIEEVLWQQQKSFSSSSGFATENGLPDFLRFRLTRQVEALSEYPSPSDFDIRFWKDT